MYNDDESLHLLCCMSSQSLALAKPLPQQKPLLRRIDRSVCKYFLFLAIFICAMPSSAIAEIGNGNLNISLEVLPRCNMPVSSYSPSSSTDNAIGHVKVECSPQSQAVGVEIVNPSVSKSASVNPAVKKSGNDVNVLVSY